MPHFLNWKTRPWGGVRMQYVMTVPCISHSALSPKCLAETPPREERSASAHDCREFRLCFSRSLWRGSVRQMTAVHIMVDLEAERQKGSQDLNVSFHGQPPPEKLLLPAQDFAAFTIAPWAVEQAFQTHLWGTRQIQTATIDHFLSQCPSSFQPSALPQGW